MEKGEPDAQDEPVQVEGEPVVWDELIPDEGARDEPVVREEPVLDGGARDEPVPGFRLVLGRALIDGLRGIWCGRDMGCSVCGGMFDSDNSSCRGYQCSVHSCNGCHLDIHIPGPCSSAGMVANTILSSF